MASENDQTKPPTENVERQSSSASSVRKPQQPTTRKSATRAARRKATSSFQPARHGLLFRRIAYDAGGQAIPGILHLYSSLIERFDTTDVLMLLAAEMAVVDYARMAKGLEAETKYERLSDWYPPYLSTFPRHTNSSRRNFDNSLKLLRELEAEREEEQVFDQAPIEEGEWVADYESPCPPLSKDDLFSEEDWSSAASDSPSADEANVPPAKVSGSPAEEAPTVVAKTFAQQGEPISEGGTDIPRAQPPADANDSGSADAARPTPTVSQSGEAASTVPGNSIDPKLPKVA